MTEPTAPLPDRGPDPMVRMTIAMPTSLRDRITALAAEDLRSPQNMALLLLVKVVADVEAAKSTVKGKGRTRPVPPPADPFTATDTSTPPLS